MFRDSHSLFFSLLLTSLFALPALAGNWGENWGTMIWGQVLAVPAVGKLGLLALALTGASRKRDLPCIAGSGNTANPL